MEQQQDIIVRIANVADIHFAETITTEMEASAKARGTGIAKRKPEYIENKMLEGRLHKNEDGSYKMDYDPALSSKPTSGNNSWNFVTGDKAALYKMARQSYMIDNNKPDTSANIADQFIHTQFFALVDKEGGVRGVYDGLKNDELEKLSKDIKDLLRETKTGTVFNSTFTNNPN